MRPLLLAAAVSLLACICQAQEKKIYLVPDSAKGIKISNIIESVNLITLETTKGSYSNTVGTPIVTPDRFIFPSYQTNTIMIFDKQGKFLHKFKKKGFSITGVQYIRSKNALFIKTSNKNFTIPMKKGFEMMANPGNRDFSRYINLELLYLDPKENYGIEKLPVPPFALGNTSYINGKLFLFKRAYNKYEKDTILYHLNVIEDNKITKSYFPFVNLPKLPIDYDGIDVKIMPQNNDSTYLIHKDYDNTLYKMVGDSVFTAYHFVFPVANTMPADYYTTRFKNNIDFTDYKNKNKNAVRYFLNMMELKDLLILKLYDNTWSDKSFIFNKHSSTLYNLGKATSDSVTYFLPSSVISGISAFDDEYLYSTINPAELIKEKANILARYKDSKPPQELVKLLDNITKFSNPVIIQFKLKANITK